MISEKTKGVSNYYSDESTEKNWLKIVKCKKNKIFLNIEFQIPTPPPPSISNIIYLKI